MTFEFTVGDLDSDDDGEEDDFTAKRILTDKPEPRQTGGGGGYTRFVGKDMRLCETHGSFRAVLCRDIPRCG